MRTAYALIVRTLTLLVAAAMVTSTAGADHLAGDAGTTADAGNTKDTAMVLAGFGSYKSYLSPRDHDWYRVDSGATTPRCVTATMTPENNASMQLQLELGAKTYTAARVIPKGQTGTIAFAVPALDRTFVNATPAQNDPNKGDPARPGHYDFTLASLATMQAKPTSAITGEDDAGNTLSSAAPLTFGCASGRSDPLTGFGDPADVYKFALYPGETLTYSFAQTGSIGLELRLLDEAGNQLGAITSGGVSTYTVPMSSTSSSYYLSVVRLDSTADAVGYLIGTYGPPSSTCRPQC